MKKTYTSAFKAKLVLELLKGEKSLSQLACEHKVHPNLLRNWRDQALHDLASLFDKKNLTADLQAAHERQVEELFAQIGRLTTQVNWLKKNLASTLTRDERRLLVERQDNEVSLSEQAQLLSLSRASLYYQKVAPTAEEVRLKHRLDELYTDYPFYGSRRMAAQRQRQGEPANRKRVQRYMREMGLEGIAPGANLSKRNQAHKVYPYLLKGLAIKHSNQVWGIAITYIRLLAGWLYLVAILAWHSRYVVSWELSDTMEMPFLLSAVSNALGGVVPEIFNSDQRSLFTSEAYVALLKQSGTQISMDGKGRALDNIFTERLWRTVKYEEVYLKEYASPREAQQGLRRYLEFYNQKRLHQALNYRTPAEVYFG